MLGEPKAPPQPTVRYGLAVPSVVRLSMAPVKGLRLVQPGSVDLAPTGVPADRRFLLVDDGGRLLDATQVHELLRVVPDYDPATELLRLTFPDGTVVEDGAADLGDVVITDVFGRTAEGRVVLGPFADALSGFAGRPVRLVRTGDGAAQDAHPLTIVSSASVEDLGARGGRTDGVDARRFRINVEVAGVRPYEEDTWAGALVRVGDATVRVLGQIPRCVVTTLGPDSGERDFPTLTHLARYRPRIGGRGGLPFGMYAEVVEPGRVALGDAVEPLSATSDRRARVAGR
jgi:uncharacterized protein YcbX